MQVSADSRIEAVYWAGFYWQPFLKGAGVFVASHAGPSMPGNRSDLHPCGPEVGRSSIYVSGKNRSFLEYVRGNWEHVAVALVHLAV